MVGDSNGQTGNVVTVDVSENEHTFSLAAAGQNRPPYASSGMITKGM